MSAVTNSISTPLADWKRDEASDEGVDVAVCTHAVAIRLRITAEAARSFPFIGPPLSDLSIRPPNGLELSCLAARATPHPFSRILAGKAPHPFRTPAGSAAASCSAAHVQHCWKDAAHWPSRPILGRTGQPGRHEAECGRKACAARPDALSEDHRRRFAAIVPLRAARLPPFPRLLCLPPYPEKLLKLLAVEADY